MCRFVEVRRTIAAATVAIAAVVLPMAVSGHAQQRLGFGRAPTAAEMAAWDIDVRGPDGAGLPPGRGTVSEGEQIFEARCAGCHGSFGEGAGRHPALAGGEGSLKSENPLRTIGSFWPFAPALFDYVRRAQPFDAPGSLTDSEVYAVVGYLLRLNDLVAADAVLDGPALRAVRLPNRAGFVAPDPRPDVAAGACQNDCRTGPPGVTSDAALRPEATPGGRPRPKRP